MGKDGSVEPRKIHTVVISTQHAEPLKAVRTKECAGYSGPEMTAPSMEDMNKEIVEKVVKRTLSEIKLKSSAVGPARAQVPGDSSILPLRPCTIHQGWNQVLRVGELQGHVQICLHGFRSGDSCAQGQQLLAELG